MPPLMLFKSRIKRINFEVWVTFLAGHCFSWVLDCKKCFELLMSSCCSTTNIMTQIISINNSTPAFATCLWQSALPPKSRSTKLSIVNCIEQHPSCQLNIFFISQPLIGKIWPGNSALPLGAFIVESCQQEQGHVARSISDFLPAATSSPAQHLACTQGDQWWVFTHLLISNKAKHSPDLLYISKLWSYSDVGEEDYRFGFDGYKPFKHYTKPAWILCTSQEPKHAASNNWLASTLLDSWS